MQIVIKIDEERYDKIKRCSDDYLTGELERAIKNGVPISKGHGRLVDVSNLLTVTDIKSDGSEFTYVPYSEIENAPTIIEADKAESKGQNDR